MSSEQLTAAELMDDTERVSQHRARGMFFLCLAVGATSFALAAQMGLNANFLRQVMGLESREVGYLEACRESCGVVALGVLALLAGFAEPLVAAAMLVVFGIGLGSYAYVPTYGWLILVSLVWSQGLHVWMPLPNSMTLALAEPGRAGRRLGQVQAAGAAGSALGLLAALGMRELGFEIRPMYLVAGAAALVGAAMCLGIPRQIKTPGPRMVFRRKYWLYYLLCFLEGWRKQIAIAFAGYLLVWKFNADVGDLLLLWIGINAIGWVTSRQVGRLIDRVGERPVLVLYYSCLTVLFIGYATVESRGLLYAIFVIDNSFFVFGMALNTYVNHIAPKSEHTPTLSMGVAMNHVAAVTMPLVGGVLWATLGYRWTFIIGAGAAALSVIPALFLPGRPGSRGANVDAGD